MQIQGSEGGVLYKAFRIKDGRARKSTAQRHRNAQHLFPFPFVDLEID